MKLNKLFIASGFVALALLGCNNNGKENKALSSDSFACADSCNDNEDNNNVLSADTCNLNEKKYNGLLNTEVFVYSDSCKYADFAVRAELPLDNDAVSVAIRESVVSILKKWLSYCRPKPVYEDDTNNVHEVLNFYCEKFYKCFVEDSQGMYEPEDSTQITQWNYSMNVTIDQETDDYVVFLVVGYAYEGGIHGNVFGDGPIVFSKKNGTFISTVLNDKSFISSAIDEDNLAAIQPLLNEGFNSYYSGKTGFPIVSLGEILYDTVYRLPDYVFPIDDSILFVYRRHENVAYGSGCSTFKLPISKVKPYLTPQAIKVFGIDD